MRYGTPALIALLQANRNLPYADCFTIITPTQQPIDRLSELSLGNPAGQQFFYTSLDIPVQVGIVGFAANSVRIEGLRYRMRIGLEVDEQEITITAKPTDLVNGIGFLDAMRRGFFDGALIRRERAFFEPTTFPPQPGVPAQAVDSVTLFTGRVSKVLAVGRTQARVAVKSQLVLLDLDMPRNLYQPGCSHTLFDPGCGVPAANFAFFGLVEAASTKTQINWAGATVDVFDQGTFIMTGGADIYSTRTIRHSTGTALMLSYPLETTPQVGDTFTAYFGCDHTLATCVAKFNNRARYRGFPFVPQPETAT